jgi:hypothetical protein
MNLFIKRPKQKPRDLEHQEQVALFQWAALVANKYPELALMFAIPNGGKRDIRTAAKLKAEGVKAGVPDVFLPVARGGYFGMFIELKSLTGRASQAQLAMMDSLSSQGYKCIVCKGWSIAKDSIMSYLRGVAI